MISAFALVVLFGICIIDPIGQLFSLKYVTFGAYLLAGSWDWLRLKSQNRLCTVSTLHIGLFGFFSFVLPVYGLLVMRWHSGSWNLQGDLTFFTAGGFLVFSLLMASLGQTRFALDTAHRLLLGLAVVEITVTILEIYGLRTHPVNLLIISRNAVITTRDYAQCTLPYNYFVAAPLLIFAQARCWFDFFSLRWRNDLIWGIIVSAALFVSGTRANQFMSLAGPFLFYVWWRKGMWWSLACMLLVMGLLLILARITSSLDTAGIVGLSCGPNGSGSIAHAMLSANEHSNAIKLSYLAAYKLILGDPDILFFGQGLNASSWSEQVRNMLPENSNITELIYPEIIRIFGLVMGGLALLGLAVPLFLYRQFFRREFIYCAAAWCFYLLVAASNPYIFSSNGMLIFGLILAVMGMRDDAAYVSLSEARGSV